MHMVSGGHLYVNGEKVTHHFARAPFMSTSSTRRFFGPAFFRGIRRHRRGKGHTQAKFPVAGMDLHAAAYFFTPA